MKGPMKWLFETFKLWQIQMVSGVLLLIVSYFVFFTEYQNFITVAFSGVLLVIFIAAITYKESQE